MSLESISSASLTFEKSSHYNLESPNRVIDAKTLGPEYYSKFSEDFAIKAKPEIVKQALLPAEDAGKLKIRATKIVASEVNVKSAGKLEHTDPSNNCRYRVDPQRGLIDTAAPFESVKEVVTKFGGITSWKAYKIQAEERCNYIEHEIKNAEEELPKYKKQSEAAKDSKEQVIRNLESTNKLIEELKMNLARAEIEESQAKQEAELAKLMVEEMERDIVDEVINVEARANLEEAKAKHAAVLVELKSVKDELEKLRVKYASLVEEKDLVAKKSEKVSNEANDVNKSVEELKNELIATKESLELAHVAHLKAEEKTIVASIDRDQDSLNWEKELMEAEIQLERLNQQVLSEKDLTSKLSSASELLVELKAELAAYMGTKLDRESSERLISMEAREEPKKINHGDLQGVVASSNEELEKVRTKFEKAKAEANCLKMAALSLNSELENQKSALNTMRQREGIATVAVASLEADLNTITSELGSIQMKENDAGENTIMVVDLPKKLQEVSQEANDAKSMAQLARKELQKARKETEEVKASSNTMKSRIHAIQLEIEASRESKRLALEAVKALQASELAATTTTGDDISKVTVSVDEYYALSKQTNEAEERARLKVEAAVSQIEVAKESELITMKKLEEVDREITLMKEELRIAMDEAERAEKGKLGIEQELREWRSQHEKQRRNGDDDQEEASRSTTDKDATRILPVLNTNNSMTGSETDTDSSPEVKVGKKKKKKLFPRIIMFFAKKNVRSSN